LLSVSIPVYNNIWYTKNLLLNIRDCVQLPEELFIIDDGSTDDYKNLVNEFKDLNIIYIKHKENKGFNYSANEAIRISSGDYISFLNNDLIINKYFFKKLRQAFLLNPNAAIICPHTIKNRDLVSTTKDDKVAVTEMGKREGWAWTARADFIKNIPPIPDFLRTYYGDDYIFYVARKIYTYNCLKMTNNYIYHYKNVTVKKVKTGTTIVMKQESKLWDQHIPKLQKEIEELEKQIKSNQSIITIYDNYIEKKYKKNNINIYSSMEHELNCINMFNCKYSPKILSTDIKNKSYTMVKYDIPFGNVKELNEKNIRRILFTISRQELFTQLDDILNNLTKFKLNHRDINPGNLIFSEKERVIKLIDFYWCNTETVKIKNPPNGINQKYSTDDVRSIVKIKNQINSFYPALSKSIRNIKKSTNEFGKIYYNGSAKHQGKTYSKIDIPYFNSVGFHRDTSFEYKEIKENLTLNPSTAIDIGSASGYTIFNLIRDFSINKAIGFEADPNVFKFLLNIKRVFCLNNIEFIQYVTPDTIFPKVDLVSCMNVHMWLHKAYGNKCDIIIKNLINSSKEMFFQTAGAESQGMYTVKSLKSKNEIRDYLINLGGKNVDFIRSTKYHGGLRHLFKIWGK